MDRALHLNRAPVIEDATENIRRLSDSTRTAREGPHMINISGALDFDSLVIGAAKEDDMSWVQIVSYEVLLPILLLLGLVINGFGIFLLTRRKLRTKPSNPYYLLLLSSDVVILVVSVSTVITLNGCRLFSYSVAIYFAHFFFTLFYILQTFTLYIILWISYDRFLALWNFKRFHDVQNRRVFRIRVIVTALLCVVIHLKHLFEVQVTCSESREWNGGTEDPSEGCEGGIWVINDDLHYLSRKSSWRVVLWVLRGLLVLVAPIILVLVFNGGIVAGLVHRRLHNAASTIRTRGQAYSSIYIALAISATFILCTVPATVHATFYADNINNCRGPYSEEVFRAVANLLLIGEHLTHFLFLSFNETFRIELRTLLRAMRLSILKVYRQSRCCSCYGLPRRKSPPAPAALPSQHSPPVFIISSPDAILQGPEGGSSIALEVISSSDSSLPPASSIHLNDDLKPVSSVNPTHSQNLPSSVSIHLSDSSVLPSSYTLFPDSEDPPSRSSLSTIEEVI
nr:probable G-protein coupled receptor AH9.1 [Procambarus clarkii]XP_045594726.1 probable G-protein coupled receptor AH9.1 [Procambarus clarkii]